MPHFSMVQVAPVWQPMLQPPPAQLRMVQVAPLAHWIWQCPPVQASMTQVEPEAQFCRLQPTWQVVMVHLLPPPQDDRVQPPVVQLPKVHVALAPEQARLQPPPHEPIWQVLPSPQVVSQLPPEHSFMWHEAPAPLQVALHCPSQPAMVHLADLHSTEQAPGQSRSQLAFSQVVLHPPVRQLSPQVCVAERQERSQEFWPFGTGPGLQVQSAPLHAHDALCVEGDVQAAGPPLPPTEVVPAVAVAPPDAVLPAE